jgi:YD repeat-containing protein
VSSVTLSQKLPSVTLSQKGRGVHHYYEHGEGNYYSNELGVEYEWIQPVGNTQYILHRPDQSQLIFSINSSSGSQTALSGYLSTIINSHGQQTRWQAYSYDNNDRLTETNDNAHGQSRKTVRVYDSLGRLISYTDEAGNTIGYAYDQAGNLTQLTYPGGKAVAYSYDANNRLSTVTDWASRTTTCSYDDNGRLVQTIYPNNTKTSRSSTAINFT